VWHLGLKETGNKKEIRETIGLVEIVFEKGKGQKSARWWTPFG